jgi:hypothetical protein
MFYKTIISIGMILSLWSCSPEINLSKATNPALLVSKIRLSLMNEHQLENLMIKKDDLIITLTDENNRMVYNYDSKLFTIATDNNAFNSYKKELIKSYKTIKKETINWQSIQIQNVNYKMDSLQINIKGSLVIKDNKNHTKSIYFEGVKLLGNWSLTKISNNTKNKYNYKLKNK